MRIHHIMSAYFINYAMATMVMIRFAELSRTNVSISFPLGTTEIVYFNFTYSCIVLVVKFLDSGDSRTNRVIRSCGLERSERACYNADNDHHLEEVCQCFSDGCNSSGRLSAAVFTLILPFYCAYLHWVTGNQWLIDENQKIIFCNSRIVNNLIPCVLKIISLRNYPIVSCVLFMPATCDLQPKVVIVKCCWKMNKFYHFLGHFRHKWQTILTVSFHIISLFSFPFSFCFSHALLSKEEKNQ